MSRNAVGFMYNAEAYTLSFRDSGGRLLSTGVSEFRCHFLPISNSVSRTPFGGASSYQAYCDGRLGIRAGDFFVLTKWYGSGINPPRRFRVDGMGEYPHPILSHLTLALSEHVQE